MDGHAVEIKDGEMNGSFEMGGAFKPYFGIGIGRSLPKKRLGFMFELGVLYQGDYKLKQFGKEVSYLDSEQA